MSPLRFAAWWAAAQVLACAPSELGPPLPGEVRLLAVGTSTLSLDRLRVAGLYRNDEAIDTTADVAVTATGTPVIGVLTAPTIDLSARSDFRLRVGQQGNFVARGIRFFGYLDADGSGGFSNGPDLNGPDLVVAAAPTSPSYAWLPELNDQLSAQTPETVEEFYSLTGDRYTAFLPFTAPGLAPTAGSANIPPPTIVVSLATAEFARHALLCVQSLAGEDLTEARVRVDPSAGGDGLCALAIPDCSTATVAELEAPELPRQDLDDLSVQTTVQCRRSGRREALVIESMRLRCSSSPCRCQRVTQVEAIVTSTGATPGWWPCGETVEVCDSSLPLYRADRSCLD